MKKLFYLFVGSFLIISCGKKEISSLPFEVSKNISCNDLYNNGYKRTFGEDVLMIGKKMNDTVIHYQLNVPVRETKIDYSSINEEENISVGMDTIIEENIHQKYMDLDPLILSDFLYNVVWQDIKYQQKVVCDNTTVYWRNFILEIKKQETKSFRKTIDTSKYKIIELDNPSSYPIDSFEVVSLIKKDTFYCSVYEQNNKYYFSSSITINNE